MTRSEFWTLTVHYYPKAAQAGVRPIDKQWYSGETEPCHYRSHKFHFSKPPSRADFLVMVRGIPWAYHAWEKDLLPLIEGDTFGWPMVNISQKSADGDVIDASGLKVGHLDVDRNDCHDAKGYDRLAVVVYHTDADDVIKRLPKERRCDARKVIARAENRIMERINTFKLGHTDIRALAKKFIRDELTKAGFFKPKSKAKRAEATP